jgi:hypothetical protein
VGVTVGVGVSDGGGVWLEAEVGLMGVTVLVKVGEGGIKTFVSVVSTFSVAIKVNGGVWSILPRI